MGQNKKKWEEERYTEYTDRENEITGQQAYQEQREKKEQENKIDAAVKILEGIQMMYSISNDELLEVLEMLLARQRKMKGIKPKQ